MQRLYKTAKGTELPLLNLRGKEYLEVKFRLVWFREDHPAWAIETDLLSVTETSAYARASIKDEQGRVIATSHKFESKKGFPDFIEKAETGAIGRALALVGYGTQFCADELDEGDKFASPIKEKLAPAKPESRPQAKPEIRLQAKPEIRAEEKPEIRAEEKAVSAVTPKVQKKETAEAPKGAAGDYRITFGKKYKGVKLNEIPTPELQGYLKWLEESASKNGVPLSDEAKFLKEAASRYLSKSASKSA